MLLQGGADPKASNGRDGRTPLHAAANAGLARLLLDLGASACQADRLGRSPLHCGDDGLLPPPAVVALLLEAGAAPAARDQAGNTPLHAACGQRLESARLLLAKARRRCPQSAARSPPAASASPCL